MSENSDSFPDATWGTHPRHTEEVADLRSHVIQSAQAMLNFDSINSLIIEPVLTPEFHEASEIEAETPITAGSSTGVHLRNHWDSTWDGSQMPSNADIEHAANVVTAVMPSHLTFAFRIDESRIILDAQDIIKTGRDLDNFHASYLMQFLTQRDQIIHDLMIDKQLLEQDALPPNVLRQEVKRLQESLKEKDKEMLVAMAAIESQHEWIAELEESITYLEDLHAGRITNEHP